MYKITNKPLLENRGWLIKRYTVENKSSAEIGDIVGCSKYSVLRALKAQAIPIRKRTNKNPELNDKKKLLKMYLEEKLSLTQIAQQTQSTVGNIWTILGALGIKTRSYKEGLETRFPNKRLGKNHPGWKGGVTPLNHSIRTSLEYKQWRKSVFERDNYTCQSCNQVGGDLEADHIKQFAFYPEFRFSLDNGQTFCKKCHKKTPTYSNKKDPFDIMVSKLKQ